jgi:hypothetical protein
MSADGSLRLKAEDADDLAVISSAVQDGLVQVRDLVWAAKARRFSAEINRFRWEAKAKGSGQRVRAGLVVDNVLFVKARKLRRDAPDAVAELLSIAFEPTEAPGGFVVLSFAGGGDMRLEVEALEITLIDLSPPWTAAARPDHGPETH